MKGRCTAGDRQQDKQETATFCFLSKKYDVLTLRNVRQFPRPEPQPSGHHTRLSVGGKPTLFTAYVCSGRTSVVGGVDIVRRFTATPDAKTDL
jgi:hypothetical protein